MADVRAQRRVPRPPDEELALPTPAGADVTLLHRGSRPVGEALVEAVGAFALPAGAGQVFVHGEAGAVKRLRRLLRIERGLPPEQLSISGYWRQDVDEAGWQESKAAWNRRVEAEEQAALAS